MRSRAARPRRTRSGGRAQGRCAATPATNLRRRSRGQRQGPAEEGTANRLTEPYVTTREKGTGLGTGHRQEDHGRPWRRSRAGGCARRRARHVSCVFRLPPKTAGATRSRHRHRRKRRGRRESVPMAMARDILIVDDEPISAMLIAAFWRTRATRPRSRRQRRGAGRDRGARRAGDPRHLAAEQRAGRPRAARS